MAEREHIPDIGGPLEPAAAPKRRWIRWTIIAVLVLLVIRVIRGLLGDIDWAEVRDAIAHLEPWQFAVLVAALLLRQFLNALPLALFIPACSPFRAMQNDQAAILMTSVAPPPSDLVMRLAMFTSWGIPATSGLAGTVMNTLSFYVVRFGAPLLGIVLMLALGTFEIAELIPALLSGAVSVALLTVLWLAFRGEGFTVALASRLARVIGRVKKGIDPEDWVARGTDFRSRVADRVPYALPRSLLAVTVMIVVDATMLVMSIRFVGVTPAEVPAVAVLVAFLVAYPLTLFPFSGLGILDAVVVATLLALESGAEEASLVAAFVVWRVITLIGPILLGLASVGLWKWQLVRNPPEPE